MGLPQLKDHHTIWTPELVEISLPLAGLARRCVARIVDQVLLVIVYVVIVLGALLGVAEAYPEAALIGGAIMIILADFVYFWGFHAFMNGQTPGKALVGIRVVTERGGRINSVTSVIRSLLNFVDMILFYGGISAFMILGTSQEKRIADFGAGTIVIREYKA